MPFLPLELRTISLMAAKSLAGLLLTMYESLRVLVDEVVDLAGRRGPAHGVA